MNTKIRFVISLLYAVFFVSASAYSQCTVSGTVFDSKDGSALNGVAVKILNIKDSSLVKGTETNPKGFFSVSNLPVNSYLLSLSYTGYRTNYKKLNFDAGAYELKFDTLKLSPDGYVTEEIKVESETPDIRFEDEKKIFDAEKLTSTKGGTALDVLRKVPMVDVDANDNVTLRGSSNVLILIDNKPMKFGSLKQVPADAIKNVEIITNPSAKYESEGVTGIINIVMQPKTDNILGYNGYVYSGIRSNLDSWYIGAGLNFKKNKWSLFASGGGGSFKFENSGTSKTIYENPASVFDSYSDGNGKNKFGYLSLGAEYEISKGHSTGMDLYINRSNFVNSSNGKSSNYNQFGTLTSFYMNGMSYDGNYGSNSASLYYNGKFDNKGKELSAEFSYGWDNNANEGDEFQQYYDSLVLPLPNPLRQISNTENKNSNFKAQTDYTHPFGENTKMETGYKGTFRFNDNDYTYDTLNYFINGFVRNTDLTNRFKLDEKINAVYGTFSHRIKGFKFKLGLRVENTHTYGELVTDGRNFTKDYTDFFPTASVSQKLGMTNEIQLSYSRRITRPNIWRLNPFVNKYNNRYISYGNPELLPEFTNSFELSYNFFSNIASVTASLFYRKSYDVISTYSVLADSVTTVTTYKNGAGAESYGSDLMIRSSALKWLTLNGTLSLYQTKFEGSVLNEFQGEEGFTWRANVRSSIIVGDLFNIDLYYNFSGKRFTATGFNDPMQNFDVGISKELFKKKLSVNIRAEDVFNTRRWSGENNGVGFRSVRDNRWQSRMLMLNLTYNFGNTDKYYQKSKKTKQNEHENQDENQNNNNK